MKCFFSKKKFKLQPLSFSEVLNQLANNETNNVFMLINCTIINWKQSFDKSKSNLYKSNMNIDKNSININLNVI